MSSTTDNAASRGQILVIFVLSLVTLILFAALAFDTGQLLLERRDQQNAADAAALAGAYYLPDDPPVARARAADVATANGFTHGSGSTVVQITTPTDYRIEVVITNSRPSVFAGIMGVTGWDVSARAVAVNENGVPADYAMLALDEDNCGLQISGNGSVDSDGNIQVNSRDSSALCVSNNGSLTVTATSACNIVGNYDPRGNPDVTCSMNEGADPIPDPLETLPAPPKPVGYPEEVGIVDDLADNGQTLAIPDGCPGAEDPNTPSTEEVPITCKFASSYAGTTWRLHPGYYPGGITLLGGTFYWEPGVYWIGGGGVQITGNGTTSISVAQNGTELDYGILIYNTENPYFHVQCEAAWTATECIGPVDLGGQSASVNFYPIMNGSVWDGLVIYQDKTLKYPNGSDIQINGSTSAIQVRGTIYSKLGTVTVNGSSGLLATDQIIANNFLISGERGSIIDVDYDTNFVFTFTAAGLIE